MKRNTDSFTPLKKFKSLVELSVPDQAEVVKERSYALSRFTPTIKNIEKKEKNTIPKTLKNVTPLEKFVYRELPAAPREPLKQINGRFTSVTELRWDVEPSNDREKPKNVHEFSSPLELLNKRLKVSKASFEIFKPEEKKDNNIRIAQKISYVGNDIRKKIEKNVKTLIDEKTTELDMKNLHFYVGITTRDSFFERFAEHSNIHENLKGVELCRQFSTHEELCFAEWIGIKYMRDLVAEQKIKSCWNKSDGYDAGAAKARKSQKQRCLYLLWTDTLQTHDNEIGLLNRKQKPQERQEGKLWNLHTSSLIADRRHDVERHMRILLRSNQKCAVCNRCFKNTKRLNQHILEAHELPEAMFTCSICQVEADLLTIRKHIQSTHMMPGNSHATEPPLN